MTTLAPVPTVPIYLAGGDRVAPAGIAAAILASLAVPANVDNSSFSLLGTLIGAFSVEMSQVAQALSRGLDDTYMSTTTDMTSAAKRGLERGLTPLPATFATGTVTFTGAANTVIPANTRIAVPGVGAVPPIVFLTVSQVTIPSLATTVDAAVIALVAGSSGNVGVNTVTLLVDQPNGITSVTNAYSPATDTRGIQGGTDPETLTAFVARYIAYVSQPLTGENIPTYQQNAEKVAGIGQALAIRAWNGPGTVGVYMVDENGSPADPALVAAVETSLINPWRIGPEAASGGTITGHGGALATVAGSRQTQVVQFSYNASGNGILTIPRIDELLPQPGIWRVRPRLQKSGTPGTGSLLTVAVHDDTTSATAPAAPSGGTASATLTAAQITTAWEGDDAGTDPYGVDVYWNGTDQLDLVITRLTSDTSTVVDLDEILLQSTMSQDTPGTNPLSSAADRVTIQPAGTVAISVSLHPIWYPNVDPTAGEAAVQSAIEAYLLTLRFAQYNTVIWGRVLAAALNATLDGTVTPVLESIGAGTFLVNSGTADVTIQPYQVPVLSGITWT